MRFAVPKPKENILVLLRQIGYRFLSGSPDTEMSFVQGASYPRFHLFIEKSSDELRCSLHLDQKKPSYSGSTAHSGEYEGEIIENEVERIKQCFLAPSG